MSELCFSDVSIRFGGVRHGLTAVDHASLTVPDSGIVGLVGESGSGKSTLARAAVGLVPLSGGRIELNGRPLARRGPESRRVQMIFQDPSSALNPRMSVGESIAEAFPRGSTASTRRAEVARLLELVHLDPAHAKSSPARMSGGQRQRVALARALASRPEVVIADEITSALDVSIQGTVINVLRDLQRELGISVLFISHNLPLVRYMSDSIAVMYLGRIVEQGPAAQILGAAQHPYTRELLAAVPDSSRQTQRQDVQDFVADPAVVSEPTDPDPLHNGCRYHSRCPVGPLTNPERGICRTEDPSEDHANEAACHFAEPRTPTSTDGTSVAAAASTSVRKTL
ncbi:ABC transporter ATP-binding protein [Arthrobacter zhaoguopingii]|uniref:ABC transporter ATP-binding protein n=1 Tax=Arthrobacter zhaoguopingii TaxID=2681491 RepID=UPI00135C1B16|nr:oligopeptide/dipeptide ABC transporter ATP-binding protein [Arthrobacter zhaoguopingii]